MTAQAGALELLGAVAYGELAGFDRLAEDARATPELPDRVLLTELAADRFARFSSVRARIEALGADALSTMEPYRRSFDEFHQLTRPNTPEEGLLKVFIGEGLAADFYREVAERVDPQTRAVVRQALADADDADFLVSRIVAAIDHAPEIGGRLALWGRRMVGEALSQAHRAVIERPELAALLAGSGTDDSLVRISDLSGRLVRNHTERMARLGLSS